MRSNLIKTCAVALVLGAGYDGMAQRVVSPCPEVLIGERYDHVVSPRHTELGWDTAVSNLRPDIVLTAEPYVPARFFNGTYTVEEIPYNPIDPTFSLGRRMDVNHDDVFSSLTELAFPFYFFGIKKTHFRLGDNGMVTFCDSNLFGEGNHCPYNIGQDAMLPWTTSENTPGHVDQFFARMHDAIYGVFEDTHPMPSTVVDPQGIYYGVVDTFPCRKIIASWNEIPLYNSQVNNRQTYQIVCFEGTNMIEVHVKRRGCCSTTNEGRGFIGIQNATGQPQVTGEPESSNAYVVDGSPAAFFPEGYNNTNEAFSEVAFRFTPQGDESAQKGKGDCCRWYRIFDDGRDSVELLAYDQPGAESDTNGYYFPMGHDAAHPTLTRAMAHPTCVSRYVMELSFLNADGDRYVLHDTITIGYENEKLSVPESEAEQARVYQRDGQVVVEGLTQCPVTVYDATGRALHTATLTEGSPLRLDVPKTGVYIVQTGNAPAHRVVVVK